VNATLLLLIAVVVIALAVTTCSRSDELNCKPPELKYNCMIECMARPCGEPVFHYEPARIEVAVCALDEWNAQVKFNEIVLSYDVKDCGDTHCAAVSDTGSAVLPAGSAGGAYHEQVETESAAAAGGTPWEPIPGGQGCFP